jgi:hypothetical protein
MILEINILKKKLKKEYYEKNHIKRTVQDRCLDLDLYPGLNRKDPHKTIYNY